MSVKERKMAAINAASLMANPAIIRRSFFLGVIGATRFITQRQANKGLQGGERHSSSFTHFLHLHLLLYALISHQQALCNEIT
jgi:hypothetical protein